MFLSSHFTCSCAFHFLLQTRSEFRTFKYRMFLGNLNTRHHLKTRQKISCIQTPPFDYQTDDSNIQTSFEYWNFVNRTCFDHQNNGHVRYSDTHCNPSVLQLQLQLQFQLLLQLQLLDISVLIRCTFKSFFVCFTFMLQYRDL